MGTRNLTVVVHKGEVKIAQYGQWDGYPDGQGLTVIDFLQSMDRDKFKSQLDKCRFFDEAKTKEVSDFLERITGNKDGWMTIGQAESYHKEYPLLSRDNGAGILQLVYDCNDNPIWVQDSLDFIEDGLSNEWTYVIDLDNNVLEVYKGHSKAPVPENSRFYDLVKKIKKETQEQLKDWVKRKAEAIVAGEEFEEPKPYIRDEEYNYNMQLVASFDISDGNVPTQESFLEFFEQNVYNKDEN